MGRPSWPGIGACAAAVLRGQAQVTFLASAAAGAVFTVALFAAGWEYGLYGLAGTAIGTVTARLLRVDGERVRTGMEGFNACLTAVCFAVFLGADHPATVLVAAGGCVVVTVVTGAVATFLGTWKLPTLTLPYCLVASVVTIAAPGFERVWHGPAAPAALSRAATGSTDLDVSQLARAFCTNIGQIFFMPQWYVGLIFLIGIFVASLRLGLLACLGSAIGIAVAWALGAPGAEITQGVMGYNAVLVMLALGGVFLATRVAGLLYAAVGAAAATGLTTALSSLFAPSGGHTFTWPFVLTTLTFLVAVAAFPALRANAPDDIESAATATASRPGKSRAIELDDALRAWRQPRSSVD